MHHFTFLAFLVSGSMTKEEMMHEMLSDDGLLHKLSHYFSYVTDHDGNTENVDELVNDIKAFEEKTIGVFSHIPNPKLPYEYEKQFREEEIQKNKNLRNIFIESNKIEMWKSNSNFINKRFLYETRSFSDHPCQRILALQNHEIQKDHDE